MITLKHLLVSLLGVGAVCAAPGGPPPDLYKLLVEQGSENVTSAEGLVARQSITSSQTGTNNGYYYSFWTDGGAQVTYSNGAAGSYSVTWGDGVRGLFFFPSPQPIPT